MEMVAVAAIAAVAAIVVELLADLFLENDLLVAVETVTRLSGTTSPPRLLYLPLLFSTSFFLGSFAQSSPSLRRLSADQCGLIPVD
jgi:hypothetical protein